MVDLVYIVIWSDIIGDDWKIRCLYKRKDFVDILAPQRIEPGYKFDVGCIFRVYNFTSQKLLWRRLYA